MSADLFFSISVLLWDSPRGIIGNREALYLRDKEDIIPYLLTHNVPFFSKPMFSTLFFHIFILLIYNHLQLLL